MIKVLYILHSMNMGGIQTFLMNIYRNIDRDKVQFDFLLNVDKNIFSNEIKELGGNIYIISSRGKSYRKYKKNLNEFFKNHAYAYDAIHMHVSSLTNILPLKMAKKYNIKNRYIHAHNTYQRGFFHNMLNLINKNVITNYATQLFACSIEAGKYCFGNNKCKIIKNGIDAKKFIYNFETRNRIRKEFNIEDEFFIGIVGRLELQKNHMFILEVLKYVLRENENVKLIIVGNGSLKNKLYDYCKQNKMEKKVIFAGIRNDVDKIFQGIDLFVMPSKFEGLGIVAIEAQAAGVKTLVSEAIPEEAYITDLIEKISLSTPDKWKNRILEISKNPIKRRNMQKEIEKSGYDIKTEAKNLEKIYNKNK